MKKKKVAIVGYTPTRVHAPYGDKDWEIWGLNDLFRFKDEVKRWTRWFEMHPDMPSDKERITYAERIEGLAKMDCPVYMLEKHPEVPTSIRYPIEDAIEQFGNYFTNSISYMIALAIMEGFEEIGVWGVDMATDSEYGHQRPSCEYFLGIAVGRGIKVYVHPAADLLKVRYLYGYEYHKENMFETKIDGMLDRMCKEKQQVDQQLEASKRAAWQYDGAINVMRSVKKVWKGC